MKVCTKCKVDKSFSEFTKMAKSPDGHAWYCRLCMSIDAKNRRKDPAFRERKRENSFRFSYGITIAEYESMFSKQNGLCAICEKSETKLHGRTKEPMSLSVDHCHNSKKVRGLLCSQCNLMLGLANDNITKLRKAIVYLSGGDDN